MKRIEKNWVLWAAGLTVVLTVGSQYYWNASNYRANRERILRDLRFDLETAVEEYFARTSAAHTFTLIDTRTERGNGYADWDFLEAFDMDSLPKYFKNSKGFHYDPSRTDIKEAVIYKEGAILVRGKTILEDHPEFMDYPNRISMTIQPDTIPLLLLKEEFEKRTTKRDLDFPYRLEYRRSDSLLAVVETISGRWEGVMKSKSEFVPDKDSILLSYVLPVSSTFRRGLFGLVLSLILSGAVLFSLYYLLRTINRQKKLSEMKDDFVSNLTHEFKTPIATASAALQALDMAEKEKDNPSGLRYSRIAHQQLEKLNSMVDKLLETASLDAGHLSVRREELDLNPHLSGLVTRFGQEHPDLELSLNSPQGKIMKEVDPFHWENTLYNLLENAAKYGQPPIEIQLNHYPDGIRLDITDHGGNLTKEDAERIFDKFYRVPRGNQHEQKGHGIGLYYSRAIVEKHGGRLYCLPGDGTTTFRIHLP